MPRHRPDRAGQLVLVATGIGLLAAGLSADPVVGGAPPAIAAATQATASLPGILDPDRLVLPDRCGECHWAEHQVWQATEHATGFDTMHRREAAEEIIDNLGGRLIKRDSVCLECHYTPQWRGGELRAAAGVSCESCHGPARDWVEVHNDYGVTESDARRARELESDAHREERIEAARAAGMLRPSDLYGTLARCFACHTVPNEQLVNEGRHGTGSGGFEVVSWTEPIRHNFLESFLTGDGRENSVPPIERRRVSYVVGRGLAVEYGLRALAAANDPSGRYFRAAVGRLQVALDEMAEVGERTEIEVAHDVLEIVARTEARRGDAGPLIAAADEVGARLRRFAGRADGSRLAGVDPFLDDPDGTPRLADAVELTLFREPTVEATEDPPAAVENDEVSGEAAGPPPSTGEGTNAVASAVAASPGRSVTDVGSVTTWPPWRDRPTHRTLRAGTCGGCHGAQDAWWFDDPHGRATDRFFEGSPETVAIARMYGLDAQRMLRGDQLCMQCHGFVATGRESREADAGAECQQCHGPGEDYRTPHETDYGAALAAGMTDLKTPMIRARTCAGCHYVTDARLLSAGHPSGASFDPAAANERTRHWDHVSIEPTEFVRAWQRELEQRGPVPEVPIYRPAPPRAVVVATDPSGEDATPRTPDAPAGASTAVPATPARSTPAAAPPDRPSTPRRDPVPAPGLEPLRIDPAVELPELILLLERRLELIYALLGRGHPASAGPETPDGEDAVPDHQEAR